MQKGILLIIYVFSVFNINAQEKKFAISGKLITCSEYKVHPFGYIYLYKDSIAIDSVNTYHSFLDFSWESRKFKFKGVKSGEYEIRYDSYFDTQAYPRICISDKSIKNLKICGSITNRVGNQK